MLRAGVNLYHLCLVAERPRRSSFWEVKSVNHENVKLRAQWLDRIVQGRYPVELRTEAQLRADVEFMRILDQHGAPLLDSVEAKLFPALKRLRWLGAATYMRRTVLGTADELCLEVGIGGIGPYFGKYEFIMGGFCHPVDATLDCHITPPDGRKLCYEEAWITLGGLTERPEGYKWFHIPRGAWGAATRPELVDFTGLPPIEVALDPLLDQVVRQAIDVHIEHRRQTGMPLTQAELGPWRLGRGVG